MRGFSLIELLITLAIISILVLIALPSYTQYLQKEQRLEATTWLSKLAIAMEKYHLMHHSYADATLETLHFPQKIATNSYQLFIQSANANHFLLAAQPLAHTVDDCGTLLLDHTGQKKVTGEKTAMSCW